MKLSYEFTVQREYDMGESLVRLAGERDRRGSIDIPGVINALSDIGVIINKKSSSEKVSFDYDHIMDSAVVPLGTIFPETSNPNVTQYNLNGWLDPPGTSRIKLVITHVQNDPSVRSVDYHVDFDGSWEDLERVKKIEPALEVFYKNYQEPLSVTS